MLIPTVVELEKNLQKHSTAFVYTAIDSLSIIWKSVLSGKIKRDFFQAAV